MASSWTLDDLAELEKAIASGVTTVAYSSGGGSKTVTYRSLTEMLRVRDMIRAELGLVDDCARRVYPKHSKGFH